MTSILRNAAFSLTLVTASASMPAAYADQPPSGGQTDSTGTQGDSQSDISIDRLNKEFKDLSPEARDALMRQLEQRGVDSLSHMSETDARTTFAGLPANVRTELQAKWDAMSDEDHEALKKLNPDTVKQMVEDKIKDKIKDTFKPPANVAAVVEKAKESTQKVRDYLHDFWLKLTGKAPEGEQPATN